MADLKAFIVLICFICTISSLVDCRPKNVHKWKANTEDDIQINKELLRELQMLRMNENRIQRPFAQIRRNFVHSPLHSRYPTAPIGQYYLPSAYNYDSRVGLSPYPLFERNDVY